jgi:UDP-N-acetylmuramoylalanine--D-glutamate ligase
VAINLKNPRGCKAAIVGTGVSGQAAARLLQSLGAGVSLFDEKDGNELSQSALLDFDFIVLSPGFPRRKAAVANALTKSIPIFNEIDIAAVHLPDCRFIGVTGTNGKSTTTAMIGEILKLKDPAAFVGGNLGKPLCDAVFEGEKPSLGVIELSSYQLETLSQLRLDVAVVTHLTPDHLDRYDSEAEYYAAKNRIFEVLKPGGHAILNGKDPVSKKHLHPAQSHHLVDFNKPLTFSMPHVVGAHNEENASAAFSAAQAIGFGATTIEKALVAFKGLPHRLEFLGVKGDVRWFNDSKATNVESAIIAVQSFNHGVHLILGGVGKGASYAPLAEASKGRVACVYTIGEDAPAIERAFKGVFTLELSHTLERAVASAMRRAQPGDVILLAPACASYDQYANYIERGEHLRRLFNDYRSENP